MSHLPELRGQWSRARELVGDGWTQGEERRKDGRGRSVAG